MRQGVHQCEILRIVSEAAMSPFVVNCEPQRVPFKYATNLQRPLNAGSCKRQESHGEKML